MDNMTAKVSCFARAFHYRNNKAWIFEDEIAEKILGKKEYEEIAENMKAGIQFFSPGFSGSDEEALRFIVDNQLSPSVLGRSAFCEMHLENEIKLGCTQYVIFAAGYDDFSLRRNCPRLRVFALDLPEVIEDRKRRIRENGMNPKTDEVMVACDLSQNRWTDIMIENGFVKSKKTFGSLLGISYYLSKQEFCKLIQKISALWQKGSAICLDFPVNDEGEESKKNRELAKGAKEEMRARYEAIEMEEILAEYGFLTYEHLDHKMMTEMFFNNYNESVPDHNMTAPKGVNYLLAVKGE